jgi:hypothetical protein
MIAAADCWNADGREDGHILRKTWRESSGPGIISDGGHSQAEGRARVVQQDPRSLGGERVSLHSDRPGVGGEYIYGRRVHIHIRLRTLHVGSERRTRLSGGIETVGEDRGVTAHSGVASQGSVVVGRR